jgi:hypothetical protein
MSAEKLDPALADIHSHISPSAHPGKVCTDINCGEPVGRRPVRAALACISPGGTDCTQSKAAPNATIPARAVARSFLESLCALCLVIVVLPPDFPSYPARGLFMDYFNITTLGCFPASSERFRLLTPYLFSVFFL